MVFEYMQYLNDELVRRLSASAEMRAELQAIYAYAWDLAEIGTPPALDRSARWGSTR